MSAGSAREVVVVGGGPAGLASARAYRAAGGDGQVTLIAAEAHLPYRRPPLTKDYLRGELAADDLPIESSAWMAAQRIGVRHAAATSLDLERRVVGTADGAALPFDACVLATGSQPTRLPVPGADAPGVLVMRTIEDSDRLAARARHPGARVVVIGSGFIGCEAAASLAMGGTQVTMISDEPVPQAARLGEEAGERIAGWLREAGVALELGHGVEAIEPASDRELSVVVQGGSRTSAETVLIAAGVKPRLDLAREVGLEIAPEGAIAVDAALRTGVEGVYAAGDIACPEHPLAGRRLRVEHWGEALNHGEVVGRRLAGEDAIWDTAPGFWSTIGTHTLKWVAWGDGHDEARLVEGEHGAFTIYHGREGVTVGVLTHEHDEDYERGRELVERGAPLP